MGSRHCRTSSSIPANAPRSAPPAGLASWKSARTSLCALPAPVYEFSDHEPGIFGVDEPALRLLIQECVANEPPAPVGLRFYVRVRRVKDGRGQRGRGKIRVGFVGGKTESLPDRPGRKQRGDAVEDQGRQAWLDDQQYVFTPRPGRDFQVGR